MSLKTFHIVFITASTLLALGFGTWAVIEYVSGEGPLVQLILGIASLLLGVGLIWYGRYFLRKLKDIGYL